MDRVIGNANNSLIPYINSLTPEQGAVIQVPYFFTAQNAFRRYNDIVACNQQRPTADLFNAELADGDTVHAAFATVDPGTYWFNVTPNMTAALAADFSQGFVHLTDFDAQSIRAYLLSQGYTNPEVDWTETINDATGCYDMYSISQGVLEEWIFTVAQNWTCINGRMDRITYGMTEIIKNRPIIVSQVTAIKPDGIGGLTVAVNGTQEMNYVRVISTLPLGALQIVDLTETDLNYT